IACPAAANASSRPSRTGCRDASQRSRAIRNSFRCRAAEHAPHPPHVPLRDSMPQCPPRPRATLDTQSMFVELKEQYRKSLQDKLKLLTGLLPALRGGDAQALEQLRQLAQTLGDSSASFGFPEISAAARAVENADDAQRLAQLPALARALLEATARAPRTGVLAQRRILLVTGADEE